MSRHQNAKQNHKIKMINRSFGNLVKFEYFGKTVTNQYCVREEIKSRCNSGNDFYYSGQKDPSSCLVF
jgi:hypothetical protein